MKFDVIIIGSGPGGYVAAIRAAQLGFKTALVEKEKLGGVCLNWGCIPTKALLKSAEVYQYLLEASAYGLKAEGAAVDFPAVIERSRKVADMMSKGVEFLMRKNKIQVIPGTGGVLPGKKVKILHPDGLESVLDADHIIIATGARPRELPFMPIDGEKVIGYRQALTLQEIPRRLAVVGSGAIGMEMAWFYRAMGSEVTVIEYLPRLLPLEDEEVSKQMERSFKKKKIKILTGTAVTGMEITDEGVRLTYENKKGTGTVEADKVLSAVGIRANIEGIGLEETGIEIKDGKIAVDTYYRTNVEGYYAIGDVIDTPALAHVASAEGITCVEHIAGLNPPPINYENIPSNIYTSPEVASVGLTEAQAKEQGYDIRVGKFPYTASGKAKAAGKTDGFVKIIIDKKYDEILGAHMVGANVTEMIAEIVAARQAEATGRTLLKTVHPHPTMSEAVMEAVADAYGEVIHL
ncbi:MAG: dihydrolipoyl dehydrogenase [Chlorobi bacterium]|nr:dihydrolipoyl dehydrogenase [Chlorobiota bacterium]